MSAAATSEASASEPATRSRMLLYALLGGMVFFWSANFIVGKFAVREFPALLAGGLRIMLAGVFMLPAWWWHRRRTGPEHWDRADLVHLAALGVLGVSMNQVFFLLGIGRTTVAHAAFVIATTPISVFLLAAAVGQERLSLRKLSGLLLAAAGVTLINLFPAKPPAGVTAPSLLGDFFIFLSGFTFAVFTVFGKNVASRHSTFSVNLFAYCGGGILLAPFCVWHGRDFDWGAITATGWLSLVYMALFPSVVCYMIYYFALRHLTASRMAALAYLQPVVALTLGVLILGEPLTAILMVSGLIIFAGVFLAERRA